MTALAADRTITVRGAGKLTPAKVKASTTVYGGSLVSRLTSTGLIQPAGDTTGTTFAGVLRERAVGNAAGTTEAAVYQQGDFLFNVVATITEADVGKAVEVVDDQTVGLVGAAGTDQNIACGKIVEFVSGSSAYIRIDGYAF